MGNQDSPQLGAVLLIGPPGSGKSLLGQALARTHPHSVFEFLNVGLRLRKAGILHRHLQHPTASGRDELRAEARKLLTDACHRLRNTISTAKNREFTATGADQLHTRPALPKVLLLEFVKELPDAYTLLEVLDQYSIPLLQVMLMADSVSSALSRSTRSSSCLHDAEHLVESRQDKWRYNAAGIIEFFSALGVLVEIAATAEKAEDPGRKIQDSVQLELQPQPKTLAALGLAVPNSCLSNPAAAAASSSSSSTVAGRPQTQGSSSSAAASSNTSAPVTMWLQQAGWCTPSGKLRAGAAAGICVVVSHGYQSGYGTRMSVPVEVSLTATLIQPVVSQRLVTSEAERQQVLAYAAASTGLSSTQIAVPSQTVATAADARWVAVPGRYHASLKCDGTRQLLVVAVDGTPYLLNRAGMMYKYPIQCNSTTTATCSSSGSSGSSKAPTLPPGTVLDGELVWVDNDTSVIRAAVGTASPDATGGSGSIDYCATAASNNHKTGYYVVFDALAVGGKQVWKLSLPQRLAEVQQLGIAKAVPAKQPAAAAVAAGPDDDGDRTSSSASGVLLATTSTATTASTAATTSSSATTSTSVSSSTGTTPSSNSSSSSKMVVLTDLHRKQQAPSLCSDSLQLLLKQHEPVSAAVLEQLESQKHLYPFPSDGLVFTPTEMPYVAGMGQMLLKWQPEAHTAVDMTAAQLTADLSPRPPAGYTWSDSTAQEFVSKVKSSAERLHADLVCECLPVKLDIICWSPAQVDLRKKGQHVIWAPQSVRWDKGYCKQQALRQQLEQRMKAGSCLTHQQLVAAVQEVQKLISTAATGSSSACASSSSSIAPSPHPARAVAFDGLYSSIMQQVQLGAVEQWIDPSGSGLEVFCYIISSKDNDVVDSSSDASAPAAPSAAATAATTGTHSAASSGSSSSGSAGGGVPQHPIAALCRGLVLHPASKTVVATPFVRFGDAKDMDAGKPVDSLKDQASSSSTKRNIASSIATPASSLITSISRQSVSGKGGSKMPFRSFTNPPRPTTVKQKPSTSSISANTASSSTPVSAQQSPEDQANLQLYKSWCAQPPATATFKLDGSFIIAFVWEGELRVTTRRRMDSEQAVWGHAWLKAHANISAMQPGWTYMFEAIYTDNTHVIKYPFEGCVLLDAVSPEGFALPDSAAKAALASELHVMAVPSIHGSWNELMQRLGKGCFRPVTQRPGSQAGSSSTRQITCKYSTNSSLSGSYEGWVLQAADGQRSKLVQLSFKQTGHMAKHMLHPLVVWDAVRCGASRSSFLKGLPTHYQAEADAILTALDGRFWWVLKLLQLEVEQAWMVKGGRAECTAAAAAGAAVTSASQLHSVSTSPGYASNSSSSSNAGLMVCSAAFQHSLQYALRKDTHFITSMFSSNPKSAAAASSGSSQAPGLRGLLLECIKPGSDGSLPGYTPTTAFKQTYAKGWAKGPQEGRMSVLAPKPLLLQMLTDEAMMATLSKVNMPNTSNIGRAMLVCRAWRRLIEGDPGFKAQAERWEQHRSERERLRYQRTTREAFDASLLEECFAGSDSDEDTGYYDRHGYGSP